MENNGGYLKMNLCTYDRKKKKDQQGMQIKPHLILHYYQVLEKIKDFQLFLSKEQTPHSNTAITEISRGYYKTMGSKNRKDEIQVLHAKERKGSEDIGDAQTKSAPENIRL